jgi:hypothetical protein
MAMVSLDTEAQDEFVDFLEHSQAFSFYSAETSKIFRQTRIFYLKILPASSCGTVSCNVTGEKYFSSMTWNVIQSLRESLPRKC